ncbi:hypothetical protein Cfor_10796, partial [Coptotermes formosanus]
EAVAQGFELELGRLGQSECYFLSLPRELEAKRDFMAKFLSDVGMVPTIPEGGYFMVADWSALGYCCITGDTACISDNKVNLEQETDELKDYRFTKWMSKNVKLQGIPPSAFYSEPHKHLVETSVRYCFIKTDEKLQQAADILQKWKASA